MDFKDYKGYALRDVRVECPECGYKLLSGEKDQRILDGEYRWVHVAGPADGRSVGLAGNALAMYFTAFESIAALVIDAEENGTYEDMVQIHLDYFDEIYKPEEEETVNKNQILLLSNGLRDNVIPPDTCFVTLTIDTQKYGFWYVISAFTYGVNCHRISHGYVEEFDELEVLMGETFEDADGNVFGVDVTFIDRLGIEERTAEVDAWVEHLIVNEGMEGKIFPTMGVQRDAANRPVIDTFISKDVTTGERRKTPIPAVRINNTYNKNELNAMIQRTISVKNGESDTEKRLFFVSQDVVDDAANREKSVSTDYERQMTSEEYGYKIDKKTGKRAASKTWEKRHSTIDNHLWDCTVSAVAAAIKFRVSLMRKASREDYSALVDALTG
jgi:hypothetical protein